ncbi:MAG: hypothetical protein IJ465_02175 [Clostridia bacterium]|nr:hypothetical protein [Clostridia bacterium]
MKLSKRILTIALSIIMLLSALAVPVVAANDLTVAGVHNFSTVAGDWRFWLNMEGTWPVSDSFIAFTAPAVSINDTTLDSAVIETYKDGDRLLLCLWGPLTGGVTPKAGDTVVVKAGQISAASGTANIAEDAVLVYDGSAWNLQVQVTYYDAKLTFTEAQTSSAANYLYMSAYCDMPWDAGYSDWHVKMKAADADSGVFLNGTKAVDAQIVPYGEVWTETGAVTDWWYYIELFGTAVAGDELTIKGKFAYGNIGINVAEITMTYDGSAWTVKEAEEEDTAVEIPYLDVIDQSHLQNATSFYTAVPDASIALTDSKADWSNRFLPVGEEDGAFFNGTRFDVDGGGGLAYQSSAGVAGFYINGFGTAVAGDKVTMQGRFASAKTGEVFKLIAPVEFTYDGSKWTRTSEKPDYVPDEKVYDNNYTGTLTTVGAETTGAAHQLYLKGDAGLDLYKVNVTDWSVRLTVAVGDDNGVFLNGNKVAGGSLFKYGDADNYWFAEGFTATTGDVITIKGDFVNDAQSAKVTITECQFQWDGSKWIDCVPSVEPEWTYHDFTITGVNVVQNNTASNGYRYFYLNINGEVPGNWDKFEGLQFAVNGGEKFDVRVGNNGSTGVICFDVHTSHMPADIPVGTTITLYAGEAPAASDAANVAATDVIRLVADYTLEWNGTEWAAPTDEPTYVDVMLSNPLHGWNNEQSWWDIYLNTDAALPGTNWETVYKDIVVELDGTAVSGATVQKANNDRELNVFFTDDTAPIAGTKVTVKAGKSLAYVKATGELNADLDGINITADHSYIWDGGKLVLESEYQPPVEFTYYDFTVSGLNQYIDNLANDYRHFYLAINGAVPGNWDKFEGLQVAVNGGEKFDVRVGNNGSTGVICFDVHTSYMPVDIAVGTTLTIYAGEAHPAADAANVAATDAIRLGADYTLEWNGSAWVLPGTEIEYTEYTGTLTTVGAETGNTNNNHIYFAGSATLDAYKVNTTNWDVRLVPVEDGVSGVYLNGIKMPGATVFKYNDAANRWFAEGFIASEAGDKVTIKGSFVNDMQAAKVIIEECSFIWNGSKWEDEQTDIDYSQYTAYNGTLTTFGAEATGKNNQIYFKGDAGLAEVFNDLIAADKEAGNETNGWNTSMLYALKGEENGFFLNGAKVDALEFQKYSDINNGWFATGFIAEVGDVLTIKGSFANDAQQVLITFTERSYIWDGNKWADDVPDTTVYTDITLTGMTLPNYSDDEYDHWILHLTYNGTLPSVHGERFENPMTYIDGVRVSDGNMSFYDDSASGLLLDLWVQGLKDEGPAVGQKITVKAGKLKSKSNPDVGINITEDITFEYNGTKWIIEGWVDTTVYEEITLKDDPISPSGYRDTSNRWDFYIPFDGTISVEPDNNGRFDFIKVSVVDGSGKKLLDKVDVIAHHAAHGNTTVFFILENTLLSKDAVTAGTVLTIHAGKAAPSGNSINGINVTADYQIKWNGDAWINPNYVEIPSKETVTLQLDKKTDYGGNENGIYLLTTDHFPVDKEWKTRISAVSYDADSGVFFNGEKVYNSSLCRFDDGKVYVTLADAGILAQDKDKVTIKGLFALDGYGVTYKELTLYYNGVEWGTTYTKAPEKTWTKFQIEGINTVTSYNSVSKQWNIYLNLSNMIPGDIDDMSFNGMKVVVNGQEYDLFTAHSYQHTLYCYIPGDILPNKGVDGTAVTIKAGKAMGEDRHSGIELTKDFTFYYYKGALNAKKPTTNTTWHDVTVTRMNQTKAFDPATGEWRFHLIIRSSLEEVENNTVFGELPLVVNGVKHEVTAMLDNSYLFIRIPESVMGDVQKATIKIPAGATAIGDAGYHGLKFTNEWTGYVFNGVLAETDYTEATRQKANILGVQAITPGVDRDHVYLRLNKEVYGTAWYEGYTGFTYYYNGKLITTDAFKSESSNNKFMYFPIVHKDVGGTAKEGDKIVIKPGAVGKGGGYELEITNEFTLVFSGGLWTQYVDSDVQAPTNDKTLWEEYRFGEGFIPTIKEGNSVLWSNEDSYHSIESIDKHGDYTFTFEATKKYDDEVVPPFYVIMRGNQISEEDPMTAEMLYGYVIQFAALEIDDPANPGEKIWSQYINLWKNGINGSLIDQYRITYIHDQTDHPFFEYEETYKYEFSVFNISETMACITVKINDRLALRYYDVASSDPFDPAINDGTFGVYASCPGYITSEPIELEQMIVAKDTCYVGDGVRVAATYPSILDGAVFTVDSEFATVVDGVFRADKAGVYTISCTYNGKDLGSKTITVEDPPRRTDTEAEEGEFPWLIVGIAGGAVVIAVAALFVILAVAKKRKAAAAVAEAEQPTATE